MLPQEGMGIWAPHPKTQPASIRMAAAKLAAHTTTKGPRALGSMCRHITRQGQSEASAARTYVSSLKVKNWPLQSGHLHPHCQPDGQKHLPNPLPNANVMANTISNVGTDHMT